MAHIAFNIGLFGSSSAGKQELLSNLIKKISYTFLNFIDYTIFVNNWIIHMKIWDFVGQEKIKSFTSNSFRGISGILFIYDITNEKSFELLKNWFLFNDCLRNIKNILVGNRIEHNNIRQVKKEAVEKFAKKYGIKHFEISSENGTNVDLVINEIVKLILENKKDEEIIKEFKISKDDIFNKNSDQNLKDYKLIGNKSKKNNNIESLNTLQNKKNKTYKMNEKISNLYKYLSY